MSEPIGDQRPHEADIKNREEKYNPRLPVLFANDPRFFEQEAPAFLRETANFPPLNIEGKKRFNWEMREMHDVSKLIIKEYPQKLQNFIYADFANQKGWMRKDSSDGIERTLPIPVTELNEMQTEDWERHKMTCEMPRAELLKFLRSGLIMWGHFPDVRHSEYPESLYMKSRLDQGQFQLVMKMLPDIADDEVKSIFGKVSSAKELHELATKEIKFTSSETELDPEIIKRFKNNLE